MMIRRAVIATILLTLSVTTTLWAYHKYLRPFRIAAVRFSDTEWAQWEAAARQTPYSLRRFEWEQFDAMPLTNYNLVVIRAMGLNMTDEQMARIEAARQQGTHFLVILPTNDRSRQQTSLSDAQQKTAEAYLKHGGEKNLLALLHYTARELGGREVEVPALIEQPLSGFFHLGDAVFPTLEEYDAHLNQLSPELPADAPRIAMVGTFLNPRDTFNRAHVDHILSSLEARGARVYPIFGMQDVLQHLEEVKPDLAIVFPHGRLQMGDQAPRLLTQLDCPVVSALALLTDEATWLADEQGMAGNFLSQSITTPELDGAIEPIAVSSIEPNERGIRVRSVISDRIERRVALAMNWLKLRRKPNAQKKVVIVYYKAPGLAALAASGLEVVPSLFHTLQRLQAEGYDLGDTLPETPQQLGALIQTKGKTLGQWAIGSYEQFLSEAEPEFIPAEDYAKWFRQTLSERRQKETLDLWGPVPGKQMVTERDDKPYLVVSRIRFGNVIIMPQPTVGSGAENEDQVASIHGTNQAVPHFYLGAYLWARYGFQADAIVHFGTHGSLEFTYGKSACLSRDCWPDILIGDVPHIYPYVINNVGEAVIAKRRSNAVIVSHLTPPFSEASLYGELTTLHAKIHDWEESDDLQMREELRRTLTEKVCQLHLAADLEVDGDQLTSRLLDDSELDQLHNYIHQLEDASITEGLHVIGRPYTQSQILTTVAQMLGVQAAETIQAAIGIQKSPDQREYQSELVNSLVAAVLGGTLSEFDFFEPQVLAGLRATEERAKSKQRKDTPAEPVESATRVPEMELPSGFDANAFWPAEGVTRIRQLADPKLQQRFLQVLDDMRTYADALQQSPQRELDQFVTALRGGYVAPSSGGDAVVNPAAVPTGRNLFGIDAEQMPSEEAWRVGCRLADDILARQLANTGHYPQQVAFSLWGGEFIRGKGTSMAQVLYLLGVRPVRNSRGAVYDVELIPSEELGRPRIDVLVQTSGQFRDIAGSRITLMDKAVQLVSVLGDETHPNFVRDGTQETELRLKQQGMAPKEAREFATARIFGATNNGSYGTNIMGLVEKGDTWENEQQVADRYLENMGGIYRDGEHWGTYRPGLLEAQLQGTEVVVQPRSSNTWGPLSLDHVYEFMGGITLAVRAKTGIDPIGYFNDLRTPGGAQATASVTAIREEARTTIWNPKFIRGMQNEGASAAASLTESIRNMYGWNVMQPSAVSQDMWDETYSVMIDDKHNLDMREYFQQKNPYALQNMTAIMLETARKGYWTPSADVLQNLATVHTQLIEQFGAGCSYETCGNRQLHEFIKGTLMAPGSEVAPEALAAYQASLNQVLQSSQPLPDVEGITMDEHVEKPVEATAAQPGESTLWLATMLLFGTMGLLTVGYRSLRTRTLTLPEPGGHRKIT